ncbi:MAG: molybdenum cofactor biosynthesis protein MoaE [Acidimicrobiia bacterium]|nr:molybdenum cofactor biosynthesis protein MoaE [Acidimicrobiia bacterium]MDH3398359.1 molybdenum cofactor biosynthesis protein MoaE [Acidimicrobiia bacterium]
MSKSRLESRIRVSEYPIEAGGLAGEVVHPGAGAVVVFLGTVRDHSPGKAGVTHLEYEAYREQVEGKIAEIVAEAGDRWPILWAVVEHRIGPVEVGEASVGVAVSSAHRAEAFEAARYLIDELKQRAPIWKKEHWTGGADWVEGA